MAQGLRTYKDAVCFVTGGASGIGRALCEELSRRGATVIIGDVQVELAQEVADGINTSGGKASVVPLDVTNFEQFDQCITDVFEVHGRLDYLFNNAGIVVIGPFRRLSLEDHLKLVDVNVNGVIHGIHATYNRMREQGFGHIVNTASVSGFLTAPWFATYGATKHAVLGITKNIRIESEYEKTGVRLSAICPGFTNTAMAHGGKFGRMYAEPARKDKDLSQSNLLFPPETLARRTLDQVAKNKLLIIEPTYWRWGRILLRFFPFMEKFAARGMMNGRILRETPETNDQ